MYDLYLVTKSLKLSRPDHTMAEKESDLEKRIR